MKKFGLMLIAAALVTSVLGGCDFLTGPDEPVGSGGGNLVISFGKGAGRAITSGANLPEDVLEALRYELTLTGPGDEVIAKTVYSGENIKLTVALGVWRIDVRAYKEDGLAGTQSVSLTVVPGVNAVSVPMKINGGYFNIAVDSAASGGTVTASFDAAFPDTTITLTVTPDEGYVLKSGSLKYRYGDSDYTPDGSGPTYTFAMPASDVAVSAFFSRPIGFVVEGPRDEAALVKVTAVHSGGNTPPTEISWQAGESVTFTLDSSGYTAEAGNLKWLVEGEVKAGTGNSLTIDARDYVQRSYGLTVMIKLNDLWYSADSGFTVIQ
jgi:hypothetical protein